MDLILVAVIFLLLGFALGWFANRRPPLPTNEAAISSLQNLLERARQDLREKQSECENLIRELATSDKAVENYALRLKTREAEVNNLQARFQTAFEQLAAQLLEDKGRKLGEQQNAQLSALLSPLQDRLAIFEQKLQQAHVEDTRQRATLGEKIRSLAELNQQMGEDARRLTDALKGDSKVQGNWGEVILERILERSGLQKGREYITQEHYQNEDAQRRFPDVVIHLPESRHLIIDSKVSLTAYERYVSAPEGGDRDRHLREHLVSVKNHVRLLSEKNYPALPGLRSPDFVMLFVAVEPAFHLALQSDPDLLSDAYSRKVILVGPTTLLATTSTVASLWRQEHQTQNALEIARLGGGLYDKFVAFVQDLEAVGDKIGGAERALEAAMAKLYTGKGSLVGRVRKLEQLGVKNTKKLSSHLLEAEEDEGAEE